MPARKIDLTPLANEYKSKTADSLFRAGSYSTLKQAFSMYHDLLSFPVEQERTREMLVKTTLLLTLRQKELGIIDGAYVKEAKKLIENSSALSRFSAFLDIVELIPVQTKGVVEDSIEKNFDGWQKLQKFREDKELMSQIRKQAESSEFAAYLYLSLECSSYAVREDVKQEFSRILERYPEIPSIMFKYALCSGNGKEILETVLKRESRFSEAYYFLGERALDRGLVLTAETNFIECYKEIPESTSVVISLANVAFALEELEKGLDFYEEAIGLAPEYRDALLGKAICLSYLGRNQEAREVCERLISLGGWFLGETYYWLGWNQREAGELEKASESVEKSKYYLPRNTEVYALSGEILFEREELKKAEDELKKAVELDETNCRAFFYLGKVYSKLDEWKQSGINFERAALCNELIEKGISDKIREVRESSLAAERKERLIRKKEYQLKKVSLTKGTAYYNAAAGYYNSGMKEAALRCAQRASLHPSCREMAEELIARLRELKHDGVPGKKDD